MKLLAFDFPDGSFISERGKLGTTFFEDVTAPNGDCWRVFSWVKEGKLAYTVPLLMRFRGEASKWM